MLYQPKRIPVRTRSRDHPQIKRGYRAAAVFRAFRDRAGIFLSQRDHSERSVETKTSLSSASQELPSLCTPVFPVSSVLNLLPCAALSRHYALICFCGNIK